MRSSKRNFPKYRLLEQRAFPTCKKCGSRKKGSHSEIFLRLYKNKDVVPTMEASQNMVELYHNKGIDILKLGCTLLNLTNIFLQSPISAKIYPFMGSEKDELPEVREDTVGGPSIVFTSKAVANETHIRKSTKVCKCWNKCWPTLPLFNLSANTTGPYTIFEFDAHVQKFRPPQNKSRSFENKVILFFQRTWADCRDGSF